MWPSNTLAQVRRAEASSHAKLEWPQVSQYPENAIGSGRWLEPLSSANNRFGLSILAPLVIILSRRIVIAGNAQRPTSSVPKHPGIVYMTINKAGHIHGVVKDEVRAVTGRQDIKRPLGLMPGKRNECRDLGHQDCSGRVFYGT